MDPLDDDLIRFRCAECGKVLGAKPGMRMVICSRCRLDNDVPTAQEAAESHSQSVRVVSVDVPLPQLLRLGVKVALAAVPLVLLLTFAACGVVLFASAVRDHPADPVTDSPAPVVPPDAAEPTTDSPARPRLWVGVVGGPLFLFGALVSAGAALGRSNGTEPLAVTILAWFLLGFLPLALGGVMCWRYFL